MRPLLIVRKDPSSWYFYVLITRLTNQALTVSFLDWRGLFGLKRTTVTNILILYERFPRVPDYLTTLTMRGSINFISLIFITNLQILHQTLPARRCPSLLVLLIFPREQIRPNHLGHRLGPSLALASWAGYLSWQQRQMTLVVVILFVLPLVFSSLYAFPVLHVFWFSRSKLYSFVFYPSVHFLMTLVWHSRPWWILQQRAASLLVLGQRRGRCPTIQKIRKQLPTKTVI